MSSTGEVACFGPTRHDAFLKAMLSTGMKLPKQNILVSIQEKERNEQSVASLTKLAALGYSLYGTEKTAAFFQGEGIPMTLLHYKESGGQPCIDDYIYAGDIHLVLMFSNQFSERILTNYAIRRLAVDFGVPLITNVQVACMFAEALEAADLAMGSDKAADYTARGDFLDARSLHEWYE